MISQNIKDKYIKEITIQEYDEIFNLINGKNNEKCVDLREEYIFRGIECSSYKLIPSAIRKNDKGDFEIDDYVDDYLQRGTYDWIKQINKEIGVLRKFISIADKSGLKVLCSDRIRSIMHMTFDSELTKNLKKDDMKNNEKWPSSEYFEIIALAQHYGMPTRALDWSYDYKIALYFAVSSFFNENDRSDCVLWGLNYSKIENSYLRGIDQELLHKFPLYLYRPEYSSNPNLNAQKGLFTFWREEVQEKINFNPLEENLINYIENHEKGKTDYFTKDKLFYKFIIPPKFKKDILKELYADGYSEEYLFPGYEGVVKSIKNNKIITK
jgi:hypothetical protein